MLKTEVSKSREVKGLTAGIIVLRAPTADPLLPLVALSDLKKGFELIERNRRPAVNDDLGE